MPLNLRPLALFVIVCSCLACLREQQADPFIIDRGSSGASIYVSPAADTLTKWAAAELSKGMEAVVGVAVSVKYTNQYAGGAGDIYLGALADPLIADLPGVNHASLEGKWEHFSVSNHAGNLFIIGSDLRGTAYGVFAVTEQIGISPWQWWADVVPLPRDRITLELPAAGILDGPTVRYRGIFLNDEDWGLQPWAAYTFEPETGDIGPRTYEKIFQLLLRLKANTIWPSMHPSTRAFFSIPGNKEMAARYHIFVGTSHAEPMLRNNVDEWDHETYGPYNYFTNREAVQAYWQERITAAKDGDHIFTVGMRGIHDSGMEGDASPEEKVRIFETIIEDQRRMLSATLHRPAREIPQVFIPYKEVLELYQQGLRVPEDITIVWSDDNYGYLRRLSDETEQQRAGGSGVYYHISYWGRPHDYLWLCTTQPGLIWYEMTRAYQQGAQQIWILNVGDIKPAEYDIEFFLDLAWDVHGITETSIKAHLLDWSSREFGEAAAGPIADLMEEYYRLAVLRKPEYMGWSQTEPTTPTRMTGFTMANGNELQRRIDAYARLYEQVDQLRPLIAPERQDAFFQLVAYPVKCAALMNHKFLYAQLAAQGDPAQKEMWRGRSQAAYDSIAVLTATYNQEIAEGKWDRIMSMRPRHLPVFAMPDDPPVDAGPVTVEPAPAEPTQPGPVFLQAADYTEASAPAGFAWKAIAGLGYSNASVTVFPLPQAVFTEEAPYLKYAFNVAQAGNYEIEIRCLPTHANHFDQQVWIEADDTASTPVAINTRGRSEEWKTNVLRNYASAVFPVYFGQAGPQSLKVFVNQTGIVIDQIAVNPAGYSRYYEIPKDLHACGS